MNGEGRHLSTESFDRYLRAGLPIDHPIPGKPRLVLFFDPGRTRVGLRGPAMPSDSPAGSGLENLNVHMVHHDQRRMIEIAISDPAIFIDAYPLLCTVADRVQLDGQSMTAALTETLRRLGHLLKPEDVPSREFEIGLLGELRFLAGLARTHGPTSALDAWRGGRDEEHDFGLTADDIEVKTTTSEQRTHWITRLTQLVPTGDRPLWLVSVQVTRGGVDGVTLGDVVAGVRDLFAASGEDHRFNDRLQQAGWRDTYTTRLRQRWRTRTAPAVFSVRDDFPRLTPDLLLGAGLSTTEVCEVRYRIDLSGRSPDTCPPTIVQALAAGRQELP